MNPFDHYWIKDDGTIYGSKSGVETTSTDPGYADFRKAGWTPSQWPRDDHGIQSADALQVVLNDYGLFASLPAYAANARYLREIAGVTVTVGGKPVPVSTRREDRDGLRDTMLAIGSGFRKDGASFKFADGVSRPATNDEMSGAIALAFAHVQACFDAEAQVVKDITSGKLKTREDVDARFDAVA